MFQRVLTLIKSDRGSAEAALVLIPLVLLFLVGAQSALAVHLRNVESGNAQNEASTRGISGVFRDDDRFIHLESSGDGQNLDLLVTERQRRLISLIPTFSFLDRRFVKVHGIAVIENRR